MSRRIAHRPRYHQMRPLPHPSLRSHKDFLRTRWTYRHQTIPYQKRSPGQGILHFSWGYRLVRGVLGH